MSSPDLFHFDGNVYFNEGDLDPYPALYPSPPLHVAADPPVWPHDRPQTDMAYIGVHPATAFRLRHPTPHAPACVDPAAIFNLPKTLAMPRPTSAMPTNSFLSSPRLGSSPSVIGSSPLTRSRTSSDHLFSSLPTSPMPSDSPAASSAPDATVAISTPTHAQKSYGAENRHVTPHPQIEFAGGHWCLQDEADGELCVPDVVVRLGDQDESDPVGQVESWGHARDGTGDLYDGCVTVPCVSMPNGSTERGKLGEVKVDVQVTPPAGSPLGHLGTMTVESRPIRRVSKFSTKASDAQMGIGVPGLYNGQPVALFTKTGGQARKAYLNIKRSAGPPLLVRSYPNAFCDGPADSSPADGGMSDFFVDDDKYGLFVIYLADPSIPSKPTSPPATGDLPRRPSHATRAAADTPIHFGQPVILQSVDTGACSPVLVIRQTGPADNKGGVNGDEAKVDKKSATVRGADYGDSGPVKAGEHVPQMIRVGLELYRPGPAAEPGSQWLAAHQNKPKLFLDVHDKHERKRAAPFHVVAPKAKKPRLHGRSKSGAASVAPAAQPLVAESAPPYLERSSSGTTVTSFGTQPITPEHDAALMYGSFGLQYAEPGLFDDDSSPEFTYSYTGRDAEVPPLMLQTPLGQAATYGGGYDPGPYMFPPASGLGLRSALPTPFSSATWATSAGPSVGPSAGPSAGPSTWPASSPRRAADDVKPAAGEGESERVHVEWDAVLPPGTVWQISAMNRTVIRIPRR